MQDMVMQAVSNISSARTANVIDEGSDSNSGSNPFNQQNKRRPEAGTGGRSSIYKGVVPQPNGHWGAQIYANHSRIWLGTFKTEIEAGRAYDSAAIKLRSSDSHRNFPLNEVTSQEPEFQEHFETSDILSMIKDGSYHSKFTDYVMSMDSSMGNLGELKLGKGKLNGREYSCHPLFSKELTPSDVGKLNRLVIPKKHAIKYFPQVSETNSGEDENGGGVDDLQLVFYDRDMRVWKFRYCYWKSSQSFVFTRGWNRFVKENELKAHDIITFYSCQNAETVKGHQFFCMINVQYDNKDVSNSYVEDAAGLEAPRLAVRKRPLHPDFQGSFESGLGNKRRRVEEDEEQKVVLELGQSSLTEEKKKSVMLFGVQIS